jgi:hypothetical protein
MFSFRLRDQWGLLSLASLVGYYGIESQELEVEAVISGHLLMHQKDQIDLMLCEHSVEYINHMVIAKKLLM